MKAGRRDVLPTRRRQDLAFADVGGGAADAFRFHALDDAGGAVVADLQVALDEAGRAFALAADQRDRLVVEPVAVLAGARAAAEREGLAVGGAIVLGDLVEVDGLAVALEEIDDALDLL